MTQMTDRPRSRLSIHDKSLMAKLAQVIAEKRGGAMEAKHCMSDAKTLLSAWILGQSEERAAQRLLTWWCVDCRMESIDLCRADSATAEKVKFVASAGYEALREIEVVQAGKAEARNTA